MRTLQTSFAVVAFFSLACALRTPAIGATLTCAAAHEISEAQWANDPFIARLRDEGLKRLDHPFCLTALLNGEIKTGDARAVEAMVQTNLPFLGFLALNSNGGSVDEAMQIGRVARRYYLGTEAPSNFDRHRIVWFFGGKITEAPGGAICASACFFAWLGGANRTGNVLGIHRPFPPATDMQKLSPAEAGRLYHDLSGKILAYLTEMDAAPHWLSDMMRIPSDDLYVVPENEIANELQGDQRALFDLPSLAQWKFARCGGLSVDEWHDLWRLSLQALNGTLPKNMSAYLHYLEDREQEIRMCGEQAVKEARWQLRSANTGTGR